MPDMNEERAKRWLVEAEGYLELGLLADARQRAESVARSKQLPGPSALLLGNILREEGELALAAVQYRKVLRVERGHIGATVGLGWCLKRLDKLDAAIKTYVNALIWHPEEGLLHFNLACYKSLAGDAEGALEALARALQLEPEFRELARDEEDFAPVRELPGFKVLVANPRRLDNEGSTS